MFVFLSSLFVLFCTVFNFAHGAPFRRIVPLYFFVGLSWYLYESKRTKLCMLTIFAAKPQLKFLLLIAWPVFWLLRILDNIGRRRKPDRFSVDAQKGFATWPEAVAYAREEAKRTSQAVCFFDSAKFRHTTHGVFGPDKELSEAMYKVSPDGKIERCFSIWR